MQQELGIDTVGVGLGDGDVHPLLLLVRDSDRHAGGSHRASPGPDAHGVVVVGVHVVHRCGVELLLPAAHHDSLRRRRGGRISERVHRRLAVVPAEPAGEHLGRAADGRPDRRRDCAADGRAHPDPLRLAHVVLRVRRGGRGLGRSPGMSGFAMRPPRCAASARPSSGNSPRSSRRPCTAFRGGRRFAPETVAAVLGVAFCYVYVYTFFQTWFHTFLVKGRGVSEGGLVLSALPYAIAACANLRAAPPATSWCGASA